MRTNKSSVVKQAVVGKIHHPIKSKTYRISTEGEPMVLPATGSITYGIHVGDSAFGLAGDHIEPSVSLINDKADENEALMVLSCLGNEATVISGEAKGEKGYVLGGHGGIEHTIVEFSEEAMSKMCIDDKVQIKAYGQGLRLLDYPDIQVMNIDPDLLEAMNLKDSGQGIAFPVKCMVPAYLMGSGIGSPNPYSGDYDIMTADKAALMDYDIETLCFGDFVCLQDCDNTYGRGYLKGAVSIGVVVHSDCVKMGHGPGIMTILSSKDGQIEGFLSDKANVKDYMPLLNR